ncbi:MAG TPA: flavin reductase family protein [Stellaceae bacterium]|nr:flavin reductase family protein [Stellaceae bacterium]
MTFTPRQFRDALGLFPTGIAVVMAADDDGSVGGLTVNSFTSVSLDPPLILVALARTISSYDIFERASHFAVSLLRDDQRHVSSAFAKSDLAKWQGGHHRHGNLAPIIHPNLVAFECETYSRHDGGDHRLLLGKVISMETGGDTAGLPLLYFRGQYRELREEAAELGSFRLEGW